MSGVLEGVRVLDLTDYVSGPASTMYLADQGADVIKVEPPGGANVRQINMSPYTKGAGLSVVTLDRNKRSIVTDVTKPEGKQIVYRLVETSDVLAENFRPGVAERLGFGYETVAKLNPQIIYASISSYGRKGPYAHMPGYDRQVAALAGLMMVRRMPDGSPILPPSYIGDHSAAMLLAYGIALALFDREKTGKGLKVETSLLGGALAGQVSELVFVEGYGKEETSPSFQAAWSTYRCKDGSYLAMAIATNTHWARLCRGLELEHLIDDPMFNSPDRRREHSPELFPILEAVYASKTGDEWLERLRREDVPVAPVLTREEIFHEPQFVENELIADVDYPGVGKIKIMGIPVTLGDKPGKIEPAPTAGQHTDEILLDLGYSREEIEQLRNAGIIA